MCTAALMPWVTGASAAATVYNALKPAPSIDIPPAPKVETPPPAPTIQEVSPNVRNVSTAAQSRQQLRRQMAAQSSWLSTKATGALGLLDQAATRKASLLGGVAAPLGA